MSLACRVGVVLPVVQQLAPHRFLAVKTFSITMGLSSSHQPPFSQEVNIIKDAVEKNCIVVFSKTTCPHCTDAKRIFDSLDVPYHTVELNDREDGARIQQALSEITQAKTVPRVFINGKCIGGASETKLLFKEGELFKMIENCALKKSKS